VENYIVMNIELDCDRVCHTAQFSAVGTVLFVIDSCMHMYMCWRVMYSTARRMMSLMYRLWLLYTCLSVCLSVSVHVCVCLCVVACLCCW